MKHAKKFTPIKIGEEKIDRNFQSIDSEFDNLARIINSYLSGSIAWNPGPIADGNEGVQQIPVVGAKLGDFVLISVSLDVKDLTVSAQVTTEDTVTIVLANNTGGAIDLGLATVRARVMKKDE